MNDDERHCEDCNIGESEVSLWVSGTEERNGEFVIYQRCWNCDDVRRAERLRQVVTARLSHRD